MSLNYLGTLLVLFSLYLFIREKATAAKGGASLGFKFSPSGIGAFFKTPSSAYGVLAAALVLLLAPGAWKDYSTPEPLSVTGRILVHDGRAVQGLQNVVVAIIPTKTYATHTMKDGTYSISIPREKGEHKYQVLAYHSNPDTALNLSELGGVSFEANGQGRFDHTFTRRTK